MTMRITVEGAMLTGDGNTITGSAIGPGASVGPAAARLPEKREEGHRIGVITMTPAETRAVRDVLALSPLRDGFHSGTRFTRVVAVRTHGQGQGAAMDAARRLVHHFSPEVLVLAGIAGAIDPGQRIGDVVVATKVVGYDLQKKTSHGTQHRGRHWEAPATVGRAVDDFFSTRGEPAAIDDFLAHSGLIGSGNVVIAADNAPERRYLRSFNDKVLAVDMESDGLGQFCHEAGSRPWVVVRGISDLADAQKDDDAHEIASRNAAVVLRDLIPYLVR
ncbi:adenosylhomocysteine nucleosidase [Saccharothrix saharensis]|uniref:Adenosylhomocysteine nucleosidase n=1 Tax=Saccharothrix saharensis TaxID=571190 RepID=A0A543JCT2_9PSEU|nr:5'-methylthioadenosine/S-adenosylhomocysteine nucleosidase [Saccharothrix saharensis]TQM80581.1 adenosylhomocysteine nucleosidase [Saccharothrix saharensis]